MDFMQLFLGLIGRLLLGLEPGTRDFGDSYGLPLKDGASPDPDG